MKYITIVIEYNNDDNHPSFYPYMPCLGGKIVGVTFDNLQEVNEELEQKLNGQRTPLDLSKWIFGYRRLACNRFVVSPILADHDGQIAGNIGAKLTSKNELSGNFNFSHQKIIK